MNKHLIATLIIVASATLTAPAFASGYGPSVHYSPIEGAPTSQRGQSAQTIRAEYIAAGANAGTSSDTRSYGGVADSTANSDNRTVLAKNGRLPFTHH
jgi:hypothetical protein